jgi:hypothetical protein
MSLYVYDVEVAPNFFSAVVIPYKGEDSKVFEISERRNDSQQIVNEGMIRNRYKSF